MLSNLAIYASAPSYTIDLQFERKMLKVRKNTRGGRADKIEREEGHKAIIQVPSTNRK